MIPPSALLNRTFRRIWLASLVSGTAVAAHETAATWTMNLMSPSGLFISLMAKSGVASVLPFHAPCWEKVFSPETTET
jgi:Transmembrane secretion effector